METVFEHGNGLKSHLVVVAEDGKGPIIQILVCTVPYRYLYIVYISQYIFFKLV